MQRWATAVPSVFLDATVYNETIYDTKTLPRKLAVVTMEKSIFEGLCEHLARKGVSIEVVRHAPVFTSEEAAAVRGTALAMSRFHHPIETAVRRPEWTGAIDFPFHRTRGAHGAPTRLPRILNRRGRLTPAGKERS